ncbi:MAG: tyrosine phenol-lyase [Deltaproteobacteria bacterium]|jgi:tryptophanase|nr:tyrosine phenol-lyase [Deltaproteobacteria bacterium]
MTAELPIIEPFRIKSVDPIRMTTRDERVELLAAARGNLFLLSAEDVVIDLLTDSGTGAMSSEQWAAVMRGDESYAGATSYHRFEDAVHQVFGFGEVVPTHQGRAAEHLLFQALVAPGEVVPNNTHFDTTRANIEGTGAVALDLPCPEAADPRSRAPFKGNMDTERLRRCLDENAGRVPMVLLTITNNAGGGQPVSLANAHEVAKICEASAVPLYIDACRFAENAYLIRQHEEGQSQRSVAEIARELFDLAAGCTMSAKKEGLANIGGFVALRDPKLATLLRQRLVVTEGFPTYGGMAGRDLEAVAQGLHEALDHDYQAYRHASIRYVCERLDASGISVVMPPGGHAVFLDAGEFLPHLSWDQFPGQALAMELYLEGGIRSCEIGSVMLGRKDKATGEELPAPRELVRLAIPRRTYTQSHMDYLIAIIHRVWKRREEVQGVAIEDAPDVLRHFSAHFSRTAHVAGAAPTG